VYECADGKWISVGAIEAKFFTNLCRELGFQDLAAAQYDDGRQDELRSRLREAFAQKSRDEWVTELAPKDTCVAPVLAIAEVPEDAHLRARDAFQEAARPEGGTYRRVAPVLAGADRSEDRA
jgi:alpha-methylacyl-CoA racemase